MKQSDKRHRVRKIILRVLGAIGALLMAVIFYIAIVMGQPQGERTPGVDMTQPVLTASPAMSTTDVMELQTMVRDFPVAALISAGSGGLQLMQAVSYDLAYEDGFARMLHLEYLSESGLTLQVDSIYPARALTLLGTGYRLSAMAGHSVAGMPSVRMENTAGIRLHAQSSTGLYTVTLPWAADGSIASLIRSLQLVKLD